MSKKNKKKTVVVNTEKKQKLTPALSKKRKASSAAAVAPSDFVFNKGNYMYVFIGLALIVLGMLLMLGGHMPDPNVWDESLIYSARRTVLAPIVILAGLGVEVYAIFKK